MPGIFLSPYGVFHTLLIFATKPLGHGRRTSELQDLWGFCKLPTFKLGFSGPSKTSAARGCSSGPAEGLSGK